MSSKLITRLAGAVTALTLGAAGFTGTALATGVVHNVDGPAGPNGTASGGPAGTGGGGAGGTACDSTGKTGVTPTSMLTGALKGGATGQCPSGLY
jgi:hypothetical protein